MSDRLAVLKSLELILKIWKEKEACYPNGEYNVHVELALLSNANKLIFHILGEYEKRFMSPAAASLVQEKSASGFPF